MTRLYFDNLIAFIQDRMRVLGISQNELAARSGLAGPTLSHLLTGKRKDLKYSSLQGLADALAVPMPVLTGLIEGGEFPNSQKALDADLKKPDDSQKPELERVPTGTFYSYPCLGSVSAGGLTMLDATQDIQYYEFIDVPEVGTDMFCLVVRGRSMWPVFFDGDLVLVRPAKAVKDGRTYVATTADGQATIKVLRFNESGAVLEPLNPAYEPVALDAVQLDRLYEVICSKRNFI